MYWDQFKRTLHITTTSPPTVTVHESNGIGPIFRMDPDVFEGEGSTVVDGGMVEEGSDDDTDELEDVGAGVGKVAR